MHIKFQAHAFIVRAPSSHGLLKTLHCLAVIPELTVCISAGDGIVFKDLINGSNISRISIAHEGNEDVAVSVVYCGELGSLIIATHRGKILRGDISHPASLTEL